MFPCFSYLTGFFCVSKTQFIFSSVGETSLLLMSFNSVSPCLGKKEICPAFNGNSSLVSQGGRRAEMSLRGCPTGGLSDFAHLSQVLCAVSGSPQTGWHWAVLSWDPALWSPGKQKRLTPSAYSAFSMKAEIFQHLYWGHLITETWLHVSSEYS